MKNLKSALSQKSESKSIDGSSSIVCASIREGSPTLVIIAWEGRRWVMPWVHFLYAWHEHEEEFERIEIRFSSHDISLEGIRLERLLEHLSKYSVEWIRSSDKRYLNQCPQDLPFIEKIKVKDKNLE